MSTCPMLFGYMKVLPQLGGFSIWDCLLQNTAYTVLVLVLDVLFRKQPWFMSANHLYIVCQHCTDVPVLGYEVYVVTPCDSCPQRPSSYENGVKQESRGSGFVVKGLPRDRAT